MAGGAGEFFSLTAEEYAALVGAAVAHRVGDIPILGAAGYGTRMAIAYARETERLGADGLLLLPPYLTEGTPAGLGAHVEAVCRDNSSNWMVLVQQKAYTSEDFQHA